VLERTPHLSQIPLGAPRTGTRIHKDCALCHSKKFGRIAHEIVMLTNATAAVNFARREMRAH
jgi:hypothetical protein